MELSQLKNKLCWRNIIDDVILRVRKSGANGGEHEPLASPTSSKLNFAKSKYFSLAKYFREYFRCKIS